MVDFLSQSEVDALLKGVTGETDELDIDISEDDWAAAMAAQVDLDKPTKMSLEQWLGWKITALRNERSKYLIIADSCTHQIKLLEEVRSRMKGD